MFIFHIPDSHPVRLIGEYVKEASPDRAVFRQCKPFEAAGQAPHVRFTVAAKELRSLDVLPNNSLLPLVTGRVGELLMSVCADDFQLIPAVVETTDGNLNNCSILNVLSKTHGIDLRHSDVTYIPGTRHIMKVSKLVCAESAMKTHGLARDADYMSYLWASDNIVELFGSLNINGVQFTSPSKIRP